MSGATVSPNIPAAIMVAGNGYEWEHADQLAPPPSLRIWSGVLHLKFAG